MVDMQTKAGTVRVLAVVVVYKVQPMQSASVKTLLAATAMPLPSVAVSSSPTMLVSVAVRVHVADNTPGGQVIDPLPAGVHYRAYPDNPGLARPYNDALAQAEAEGYDWLLTLDQDTSLPTSFLADMATVATAYEGNPSVAAIVPRIVDRGRLVSPFQFVGGWLPRVYPAGATGEAGPHLSALNSASLLKVRALRAVGGYDEKFPLHNSDTRLYGLLDAAGKRTVIAGHVVVPHELSILDRENRMSPERYRHMLEDECLFWDSHMGALARAERLSRLVLRYIKGALHGEEAAYRRVTLAELWRRLTTSHKHRAAAAAKLAVDV